jgi:carbon-monoxide dehydrogenase large subunit
MTTATPTTPATPEHHAEGVQPPELTTSPEIGGIGHSLRRKEDDRFLVGAGRYLDDIHLPGMLHMAILRSPLPHARIVSINTSAAQALPGVVAVVTGETLAAHGLAWMPTLSNDTAAVLATDKVRFQGQEVAAVVAEDPYVAEDALELIDVDYEPLPVVVTPQAALAEGAPVIRDDKEGQGDNCCYRWDAGDADATERAFAQADRVVRLDTHYPRSHPAPLETCGCIGDVNPATGHATIYMTSQAPHAIRTVFALVTGMPEQNIRVISPDIGGGFGNKVPVYPGYVVATAASLLIGRPVKWVESRSENLISTGFARDFHMSGELALREDGTMLGLRVTMLSDQGYTYADAQPTKLSAGLFHVVTGSYDLPTAHVVTRGAYTNKAPGGVAYRCSFRVTEASFLIERLVQSAAYELEMDPAELRMKNFVQPEQFPYHSATGFVYDSGDYPRALQLALDGVGYQDLRREQEEARRQGKLIGIGIASFTEVVGAGPHKDYDILGLKMFDSAELRVHPTGKAILKLGVKSQGQGHETTFAQIVANELGIPATDITVQEGDTDNTPYGLGTYASRSTPVAGAATAVISRKLREKARKIAAHLLETSPDDLEWTPGRFSVKGVPEKEVTIQDVAFAAYTNFGDELEPGLEGVHYYDPPNMTYPFGSYVVVVEVDPETGQWHVRRMLAVDDCGVRINPMIVEGQIHGGLAEGFAMSNMQYIDFDEDGNAIGTNFMDYLIPTAVECPRFELDMTVTPSPHHPIGAKGVGESATVGSPAAYVNAVVDAVAHLGVRNVEMPAMPSRVWEAVRRAQAQQGQAQQAGVREGQAEPG